jgi:EAL domain-containing protein (putative c-di-GMP-specific phosphodiesterase class I)
LARWNDERLGEIPPAEFIPIAEQIGVIENISDELLRKAIAEAVTWPEQVALSYNLSTVQLCSRTLAARILCEVHKQGLSPERLQIEVTETVLLVDFDTARANLSKLRAEGVRVSLDDFGAGYASISYLQEMQFDCVKLDGSLVKRATASLSSKRLLSGVIDLCASLAVPCVAEQVETQEQLDLLIAMECAKAQGFLLSEPLPPLAARQLVSQPRRVHLLGRLAA